MPKAMECELCGKEFTGHKRRFCGAYCRTHKHCSGCGKYILASTKSGKCRKCSHFEKRTVPRVACKWCGREFFPNLNPCPKNRVRRQTFCSRQCAAKWWHYSDKFGECTPVVSCKKCGSLVDGRKHLDFQCTQCFRRRCRNCGVSIDGLFWGQRRCEMCVKNKMCKGTRVYTCVDCGDKYQCKVLRSGRCEKCSNRMTRKRDKVKRGKYGVNKYVIDKIHGKRCQICDRITDRSLDIRAPLYPHLDHVIPVSKGGRNNYGNIQLLCNECNINKSDYMPLDSLLGIAAPGVSCSRAGGLSTSESNSFQTRA